MTAVYNWSFSGGAFVVEFRSTGVFYSSKYAISGTTWEKTEDGKIIVDWKKYGKYEFSKIDDTHYDGFAVGNEASWRKLELLHEFNEEELSLQGKLSIQIILDH